MTPPVEEAQRLATELGHDIEWDIAGEHIAHGHCTTCGAAVHVARSEYEGDTLEGEALAVTCSEKT